MAAARHCHPSECHDLGRDYRRPSRPTACGPRPCSVLRRALRRRSRPGAESPAGQLHTLQRRVRQWRMVMARQLICGNPDDAQPWEISVIGSEPGTNTQASIRKSFEVTQRDPASNCTSVSPEASVLSNHSFTAALMGSHTNVLKKQWRIRDGDADENATGTSTESKTWQQIPVRRRGGKNNCR